MYSPLSFVPAHPVCQQTPSLCEWESPWNDSCSLPQLGECQGVSNAFQGSPQTFLWQRHSLAQEGSDLFCFLTRWTYLISTLFQQNKHAFYLGKEKTYSKYLGLGINFTIWNWRNLRKILKFCELQVPHMYNEAGNSTHLENLWWTKETIQLKVPCW